MEDFKSKWLKFIDYTVAKKNKRGHMLNSQPKTNTYVVRNKESETVLGIIKWYGPFRQYSFFPEPDMVFEKTCLTDLSNFLKKIEEERKSLNAKEKIKNG